MYAFKTLIGGGFLLFPLTGLLTFNLFELLLGIEGEYSYKIVMAAYPFFMISGLIYSIIMVAVSPDYVTKKMKKTTPKSIFKYSLLGMCAGAIVAIFLILIFIRFTYTDFKFAEEGLYISLLFFTFCIAGMMSSLPILSVWLEYRDDNLDTR